MLNKLLNVIYIFLIVTGVFCLFNGKVNEAQVMFLSAILVRMEI